jgi:hypothetical protein
MLADCDFLSMQAILLFYSLHIFQTMSIISRCFGHLCLAMFVMNCWSCVPYIFLFVLPFFYVYILCYCTLVHPGSCVLCNVLLFGKPNYSPLPITAAAPSKAWTVFARSNAGIVGSNPTRGMDVCVCLFCVCVCVVLCIGTGLATCWSSVQCVLPCVYKIKKLKKRPRSNKGLYSHIYLWL